MKAVVLQVALASLAAMASAQVPVGPEFQVNTETMFDQGVRGRSVAMAANGDFVVVWQNALASGVFPDRWDVRGQRFDAAGSPRGSEFVVHGPFDLWTMEVKPTVASSAAGSFVVAWWHQAGFPPHPSGIVARRYDSAGSPIGPLFRVNSSPPPSNPSGFMYPALASNDGGRFVVAWRTPDDGDGFGVSARVFDAAGTPVGDDFQVSTYSTGNQFAPAVDMDAAGNFVVTWLDVPTGGPSRLSGRRFDPVGAPRGSEFLIDSAWTASHGDPAVTMGAAGEFVVAWSRVPQPAGPLGGQFGEIFAQRFDPSAIPIGPEFRVDSAGSSLNRRPSIDGHAAGGFSVAWEASGFDGSDLGIAGRRFSASGAPQTPQFLVNSYTTFRQVHPAVAAGPAGNLVVVWTSYQDGAGDGVFGQRFGGLQPTALAVDATARPTSNGNGVFEPGETVDVSPSWRNVSGAVQSFGGAASSFSGPGAPGNPAYLIADGSAAYGSVADGASASCASTGDCYVLGTTTPATRPAQHWDASFREDITPAIHAQAKDWTLHIGDSFSDVSISSPFYRFIETMLHRGLATGCGLTFYCPSDAVTREQMAVFVLVAKEGTGYAPPACTTPAFTDVPVSSPFCRWIEELARRGVVAGCGGGKYCPTDPVTREQMAVFVLRTLDGGLNPPPCTTPVYNDVPANSGFCRWIEELTRRNVVTGCGGGSYCPADPVTREQMGVFISVTFGLTLYGP